MLWYKAWREVRWLFFLALPVLFYLARQAMKDYRNSGQTMSYYVHELPRAVPGVSEDYVLPTPLELFLSGRLFGDEISMVMLCLALLLGIAGFGLERSRGTATFSLALPFRRRRMLLTRFGWAAGVLLAVALAGTFSIVVLASGSNLEEYRVSRAILSAVCVWAGAMMALSLSFLAANLIGEPIKSIAAAAIAIFGLGLVPQLLLANTNTAALGAPFDLFRLLTVADLTLLGKMPWARLLGALLTSGFFVMLALALVEGRDY